MLSFTTGKFSFVGDMADSFCSLLLLFCSLPSCSFWECGIGGIISFSSFFLLLFLCIYSISCSTEDGFTV